MVSSSTNKKSLKDKIGSLWKKNSADPTPTPYVHPVDINNLVMGRAKEEYINQFLAEHGFLPPRPALMPNSAADSINVSISTAEAVFLPTSTIVDDEYLNYIYNLHGEDDLSAIRDNVQGDLANTHGTDSGFLLHEEEGSNVTQNIAVVVSIKKRLAVERLRAELTTKCNIHWPNGVPPEKKVDEEVFLPGEMYWDFGLDNFNLFIPQGNSNVAATNKHYQSAKKITRTGVPSGSLFRDETFGTRLYKMKTAEELSLAPYWQKEMYVSGGRSTYFEPGDYVYILPLTFYNSIPETISSPNGKVQHMFAVDIRLKPEADSFLHKKHDNSILAEHPIKVLRSPPLASLSTANRPLFINRVWNDALSYEISLPSKFISMNGKIPFKLQLVPLEKNISVKRVKVSVVEKICFSSKDLCHEFDQIDIVKNDPYHPLHNEFMTKTRQQRTLPLLEVRTRSSGEHALKEDVIENAANDNLLSFCYLNDYEGTEIANPLVLNTELMFPSATSVKKSNAGAYGVEEFTSTENLLGRRHKSTDEDILSTKYYNRNHLIRHHSKRMNALRGLYADSTNFKYIHIKHKLEVTLRISKPDFRGVMKHYEVMVDSPIVLMNESCTSENLDLPSYDRATFTPLLLNSEDGDLDIDIDQPPSFEQAISVPNSPILDEAISFDDTIAQFSLSSSRSGFNDEFSAIDTVVASGSYRRDSVVSNKVRRLSKAANFELPNVFCPQAVLASPESSNNSDLETAMGNDMLSVGSSFGRLSLSPPTYHDVVPQIDTTQFSRENTPY